MEDLTSILGIVIAAGILVAKAAVRKKGTDAAKGNGPADPHGEAWPQIPPVITRPAMTTPRPAMTTPRPAMTRDEESEPASDTAFGPVARKIAAARKSMQAAEEMTAAVQENRRKRAETPASDFDLRKAVIAAEILRPKFDE